MARDVMFNQGFAGCQDRMTILEHKLVPRDMSELEKIELEDITDYDYVYVSKNGILAKASLKDVLYPEQVQADWNEEDSSKMDYIKNKPALGETMIPETIVATANVGGVACGDIFYAGTQWSSVLRKILTDSATDVNFYWGIVDSVDSELTVSMLQNYKTLNRKDLVDNWWEWPGIYELDNQYQVIAFDTNSNLKCDIMEQEGLLIEYNLEGLRSQENGGWKFYYLANPSTGKFRCKFHFIDDERSYKSGMYWGVLDHRPSSVNDLETLENGLSKTGHYFGGYDQFNRYNLLLNGWTWNSPNSDLPDKSIVELDGEWNVLAVSSNMHLITYEYDQGTRVLYLENDEGFDCETFGDWTFYYLRSKSTGTFSCTYRFKEGD